MHLVHGQLDLTPEGTIAVDGRSSKTNLPGVFAAGDVIDPTYRQAVTAAASGNGCRARRGALPHDPPAKTCSTSAADGASGDLELTTTA